MYTELVLFRNELKNKQVYTYKLIGMVSEMLFSKEIFPKNKDISLFLNDVFDITYKDYVMKSRSMIVAKISKAIHNSNEHSPFSKKLLIFVNIVIEKIKTSENISEKKIALVGG